MKGGKTDKACELEFSVPFHDLDPMKVMWHGNYFKYFDITRDQLFRDLGVDLYQVYHDTQYIFPIIRTQIKHVFPLKFRDAFICRAQLMEAAYKIVIDFQIRLAESGQVCSKGRSEQAAVKIPEMETMLRIPETIRKSLGF
ncbi:MAG: acyl-CoA thioesterase [Thermodesulfobacteriota bacterium]